MGSGEWGIEGDGNIKVQNSGAGIDATIAWSATEPPHLARRSIFYFETPLNSPFLVMGR